mmetsp:Transcript_32393/g.89333  ORF Transcript_32393/g.89333 Transcript_32393/m.89333 type:complete len:227 (-) Transcript_32393:21-701(-)
MSTSTVRGNSQASPPCNCRPPESASKKPPCPTTTMRRSGCARSHLWKAGTRISRKLASDEAVGHQAPSGSAAQPSHSVRKGNCLSNSGFGWPSSHVPDHRSVCKAVSMARQPGFSPKIATAVSTARRKGETTRRSQPSSKGFPRKALACSRPNVVNCGSGKPELCRSSSPWCTRTTRWPRMRGAFCACWCFCSRPRRRRQQQLKGRIASTFSGCGDKRGFVCCRAG